MTEVTFSKEAGDVGVLTMSHPDTLNAMDEEMAKVFRGRVDELKSESLNSLIITGAGKAFSAGGNLDMLQAKSKLSKEENHKRMIEFYNSFLCVRELGVPLIAAVHGHAIGAGFCLALACDIRVIAHKAKLGLTFTKLGLHPGMGATYFLPRVVGKAAAYELLLTGRIIQGEDVARYGVSQELHESDGVMPRAREIAAEIGSCGPLATKQLLESLRMESQDLKVSLEREATCQSENYIGAEFMEGVTAIKEKRPPKF